MLLGRRSDPNLDPGQSALLVCSACGDLDCGAVVAKVAVTDTDVTWSDWCWVSAGLRQSPLASDHPPNYTFDRAAYEDTLGEVTERLARMPYDALAHRGKRFLWPWEWGWKLP